MLDTFDLMPLFDQESHLDSAEKVRGVFCDVNSTSYGPCPLKDVRGSGSPRQRRIFSGIHCRCQKRQSLPSPRLPSAPLPLSKKGEEKSLALPPRHTENCPNFSSFISSAERFKSNLLLRIPHAIWALFARAR